MSKLKDQLRNSGTLHDIRNNNHSILRLEHLAFTGYMFTVYSAAHNVFNLWGHAGNILLFISACAGILSAEFVFTLCFHSWLNGHYRKGQEWWLKFAAISSSFFITFGLYSGSGAVGNVYFTYIAPLLPVVMTFLSAIVLDRDVLRKAQISQRLGSEMHKIRRRVLNTHRANAELDLTHKYEMGKIAEKKRTVTLALKQVSSSLRGWKHTKSRNRVASQLAGRITSGVLNEIEEMTKADSGGIRELSSNNGEKSAGGDSVPGEFLPPSLRVNGGGGGQQ